MTVVTSGPVHGEVRERAVEFLGTFGISRSIQPADRLFVARDGAEVVGAVRLADEDGVLVLRGMRIRADFQRRGLGSRLLDRLSDAIGEVDCWCIPYSWLTAFYGRIGFALAPGDKAPTFLAERQRAYAENGIDVVIMVRRSSRHT